MTTHSKFWRPNFAYRSAHTPSKSMAFYLLKNIPKNDGNSKNVWKVQKTSKKIDKKIINNLKLVITAKINKPGAIF